MQQLQCCILAAGKNRYTGAACSLWSFGNGKSILDWQIHSIEQALPDAKTRVVVGYRYEEIIQAYPQLNFTHVLQWQDGTALQSFLEVPYGSEETALLMYGDTLFHPETLNAFTKIEGDIIVGIDSAWQSRFHQRSQADIQQAETLTSPAHGLVEYTGLLKLSPKILRHIAAQDVQKLGQNFLDLLAHLQQAGFSISYFDLEANWAEMNEPNDLVHFILGTKAETLQRIKQRLQHSTICEQYICLWQDWQAQPENQLTQIAHAFKKGNDRLIMRSSSSEEDGWHSANAGAFESVLNVDATNPDAVTQAIDKVFASYGSRTPHAQVLVQPYIDQIMLSGVLFTCDLVTGAPYYTINYDDISGSTETVTSGQTNQLKTVIVHRANASIVTQIDERLAKIISAAQELQEILGYDKLDIEFAIDKSGQVYTFQVRPIVVAHTQPQLHQASLQPYIDNARQQFKHWQNPAPHILGDFTVFSNMSDWNPAEIIGQRPNPLAVSLYRHIITDDVWAKQRAEFGYRDVRPSPLIFSFCAQPYVDCRASLNSFIPASLPDDTAKNIVTAYLEILRQNPHLHDKVEIDIAFTIWEPSYRAEAEKRLHPYNVSKADIDLLEQSLKDITAQAFTRLPQDLACLAQLETRFEQLKNSKLERVEKTYQALEDCKTFGTLAFSHAARAGFVAVTFLKGLVRQGIISHASMLAFQASVQTVAGDLQHDVAQQDISLETLVAGYGHLRPGTYDVNQKAYWEDADFYFFRDNNASHNSSAQHGNISNTAHNFSTQEMAGIEDALAQLPNKITVEKALQYFRDAIQAREKVKFIFSRNVSFALDQMIGFGADILDIARADVGFLTWADISHLRTGQIDASELHDIILQRKANHATQQSVKLPAFIGSENDFFGFAQEQTAINFITQQHVIAELIFIDKNQQPDIDGKIAVIPNADPGFDWLFLHNIAGLITQYGGANSHMAIRCAELGLPAAIGVGDQIYDELKAGRMMLDCLKGHMEYV